jgi:transcription elongation factor
MYISLSTLFTERVNIQWRTLRLKFFYGDFSLVISFKIEMKVSKSKHFYNRYILRKLCLV